jgi:hypothetical protein
MSNISLSENERYTFAKVNGVPLIIGSTDGAEDTNHFRNDVEITGSIRQDGNIILDGQLKTDGITTPIDIENTSDINIEFTSTNTGPGSSQRYVIGIDSNHTTYGNNTFAINQGTSLGGDAGLRISGSTVILDYDELATSATGLPKGAIYRDGSNNLKIVS